jgi:hypothetical protein
MKLLKCLVLSCALVLAGSAIAQDVKVPLVQHSVPSDGLKINYDMTGASHQKVVCLFSNFYKGYFNYTKNGVEKNSMVFGGGADTQQIVFTSNGKTLETQGLDSLDQLNADAKSYILLPGQQELSPTATVTCFYQTEDK